MSLRSDSIVLDVLSSDPGSPEEGQVWYNTTEKRLKSFQGGAVQVAVAKHNFGAITNPGTSDDSSAGYSIGSRWINTSTDEEYVCLDATAAAAVWKGTTSSGGGDADAIHDNVSGEINAITEKVSVVNADLVLIEDSAASYAKKKVQLSNIAALPGPPNGTATGDLAGSYPSPTVAQASQAFAYTGVISPASFGTSQNDYNPAGLSTATVLRLTASANVNITGLAGGASGRIVMLINVSAANTINIMPEDAASSATNRFTLAGSNYTLQVGWGIVLIYDGTTSRWRIMGVTGGPTGAASGDLGSFYPGPAVMGSTLSLYQRGDLSPASIGANQNDYNPGGFNIASILRLTSSGNYNITGLAGGSYGRLMTLINIGSNTLTLTHEDTNSTAANRFNMRQPGNFALAPSKAANLWYDSTTSRWRLVGSDDRDATAIHSDIGSEINGITTKASPVGADVLIIEDSAASYVKKKVTISSLPGGGGGSVDTYRFVLSGKPAVLTGMDGAWIVPRAGTITRITLWRRTAGASGSTTVDVNKNGTTLYTTQGNRPTVTQAAGNNAIDATTDMDVTSLAQNDRIEVDIDAVETGNPQDIAVIIEVSYT